MAAAGAALRLRLLYRMLRVGELLALVAFLSWSSSRVPSAAAAVLRFAGSLLLNARFVFVLGNAIVLLLLALSRHDLSASSSSSGQQTSTAATSTTAAAAPPHGASSLRKSSFGAADLFSLHPTPRPSSFDEQGVWARSAATVAPSNDPRDVHLIEWSSGASATSEVRGLPVFHGGDLHRGMDSRRLVPSETHPRGQSLAMTN